MATAIVPALYRTTLAQPLNINGNDTEVYVTGLTTLTGETIAFSDFSPFTRGILTVDPDITNSTQPELISFTGVDATGIGFTGCKRGLSAVADAQITANQVYHPAGTPVILGFGGYNIEDILAYMNSLLPGTYGNSSVTNAGITKSTGAFGLATSPRARHAYVSQQTTGTMYLIQNTIAIPTPTGTVVVPQTTTSIYTAPVTHPRIDLLVYNVVSAGLAYRTGTEASSPSAPTPVNGDCILCSIYHRVGETKILEQDDSTDGYIQAWFEPQVYYSSSVLTGGSVTAGYDQSQIASSGTTQAVGKANTTGNPELVAQSFFPMTSSIMGAAIYKVADTGTFTGTVKVSLQADSSGSPSGTDLASYTISNAIWTAIAASQEVGVQFGTQYTSLTVGNKYWIVVTPSTNDSSNHPNLGANSAGGYANGTLKYYNGTDGWVTVSTTILYFKSFYGTLSQIVETNPSGIVPTQIRGGLFAVSNPNTTLTTTGVVDTFLLPGGFFSATSGVRIKFICYATTNSTASAGIVATFQVILNGTTVGSFAFNLQTNGSGNIGTPGNIFGVGETIVYNTGATNTQAIVNESWNNTGALNTNVTATNAPFSVGSGSLDTTEPVQVKINVSSFTLNGGGSGATGTYFGAIVEKLA